MKNVVNVLHDVHVNVGEVDRNSSQIGGGQAAAPRGGQVVGDGTVNDACLRGGNLDALTKRGAFVGRQRKRLQTFHQAQVADSSKIKADISQGICGETLQALRNRW